jgi:capsular exopolysaccharide synthesis family protein
VEKPEKSTVDQAAILRGVWRRHKRLVTGIFFGLAIPLLALVHFTNQPLYVSSATIGIESSQLDQIPLFRELPRKDNIATHLILLKSRSLSEGVVEALPKESFQELITNSQYTDYVLVLTNKISRWMGKSPTVLSPQQQAMAELQKARMDFVQSPQAVGIFNIKGTASSPRVAMDLVNTHIQVLLSRTRSTNQEDARKAREFLEVQSQQIKDSLTQAEETAAKFEQQKGRIRLGAQTELDLVRLSQTENAMAEAQASREVLAARIAGLRHGLDQGRARVAPETQEKEKDEAPAPAPSAGIQARFNAFRAAQERLAKLEARLSAMRERYTEAHPLVQSTQEDVAKEQARVAQMARELPTVPVAKESPGARVIPAVPSDRAEAHRQLAALETEEASLQAKAETLKIQVERLRKSLRNLSQEEVEFSNLRRTVEGHRNLMTVISDKLMAARIREQGETGLVRIIDPASFPLQPSQSKTQKLVVLVLALAGGLALGAAFGIEFWRQPTETESDVQKLTGLTVLGSVGLIGPSAAGQKKSGQKKSRKLQPSPLPIHLPSESVPGGIPMELYRAIRAAVETERLKSPFRSVLVTSPGPSEGKSTTILNLAHVFQEFGRRVLVVEADLRRPVVERTLSLSGGPNLLDFLAGTATFEQVCRPLPSGVTVISGQVAQEDPASLLASSRLKELLDLAKAQFDLVLVDSPPILAVPDNLLLINALDRVILVVKACATSRRDLRKAQKALEQADARVLGVVLNQANPQDVHYYHRRYRKYYGVANVTSTPEASRRFGLFSWRGGKK